MSTPLQRRFELPADHRFTTLYEDETLLAIDKPAGVVVHPTYSGALSRGKSVIELLRRQRDDAYLTLTHRLDRETSGVLLLAKTLEAAATINRALERRLLRKTYLARVQGAPPQAQGSVTQSLGKHPTSEVYVRRACVEGGVAAETRYSVLHREAVTSVLQLEPLTGRTHQLRVHCEWLGCPIVGDPLYGHPDSVYLDYAAGGRQAVRMQLHCSRLEIEIVGGKLDIQSPAPDFLSTGQVLEQPAHP